MTKGSPTSRPAAVPRSIRVTSPTAVASTVIALVCAAMLLLAPSAGQAAPKGSGATKNAAAADPVIAQVLQMLQGDVSEQVINAWLDKTGSHPSAVGSADLVALRKAHASDALMQKLIELAGAPDAAAPAPGKTPTRPAPAPSRAPAASAPAPNQAPATSTPSSTPATLAPAPSSAPAAPAPAPTPSPAAPTQAPQVTAAPAPAPQVMATPSPAPSPAPSAAAAPAPPAAGSPGSQPLATAPAPSAPTAAMPSPGASAVPAAAGATSPAAANGRVAVHYSISYRPVVLEDEERYALTLYVDGKLITLVQPSMAIMLTPARTFDADLAPGRHVLRVVQDRRIRYRTSRGYTSPSHVDPSEYPFELQASPASAEINVHFGDKSFRHPGPTAVQVQQGGRDLLHVEPAAPNPEDWPAICEDIPASLPKNAKPPVGARHDLDHCLHWADLWKGNSAIPSREEARAEIERLISGHVTTTLQ